MYCVVICHFGSETSTDLSSWPIKEYTEEQLHMFDVRPGFSGWAQIHGRKDVEWNHRIELNVWYVRHIRFTLDVQIFFTTIFKYY